MTDTTVTTEAPSTERAYGQEGLERAAGYVPLETAAEETPDDLTVKEAAKNRLKELSGSESTIITHTAGLPDNVTMTLDQAADALADARGADAAQAEIDGKKAAQKEIDKLRGEKPAAPAPIETEADIEKVLANPKIRDAIAARVGEADAQRTHYEAAVAETGKFAIASLFSDFPEMENVPLTNWVSTIQAMHQREPARAQLIINKLQTLGRVEASLLQIKAQKATKDATEFKAYAAKENARFSELTKGMAPKEMAAVTAEIPRMLAEYGVSDPHQFLAAIHGQSTFPRASAERIMVDAAKYRLMMKNAKLPRSLPPVPHVQKPGFSGPRTNQRDVGLAALSERLNKTGNLKDAAALLSARRSKGR